MVDPDGGMALCFNGEIYNYRELRDELSEVGTPWRGESDTEVLLRALGSWGVDCVSRLRGMFAFAAWNRENRSLLLARDRLGIKPLYYYLLTHEGGERTLLFASELRALLASGCVPRRLAREPLATYVWNGYVCGDESIVSGVHLLPGGTVAELSLDSVLVRPRRYWQLPTFEADESGLERVRAALRDAVGMRLVSDVPLGVFLSGGIDSSGVAAVASEVAPDALRTFTITFEEQEYSEAPFARAVAEHLKTKHVEVMLSRRVFQGQLDDALHSIDQPTFDAINTYAVSRAVREAGITVALAGTGGDELFGGYSSFRDLPPARVASSAASWIHAGLRRRLARIATRAIAGGGQQLPPQTRWGKLMDVLDADGDVVELYQIAYALYTRAFASEMLADPPTACHSGLDDERAKYLHELISNAPTLHGISLLELSSFIGQRLLRDTDAASMAVSLEVRVPLLDHVLIEEVARLEPDRRFRPVGRKQALRDIALDRLPRELFERPKSGFVLPLETWCRTDLQRRVGETLNDRGACERSGLNPDAVARLWRAFVDGAPGLYWSRVWAPFILLEWCEQHQVRL
jgi:asparagine synthase (glutamine-hydrolysing)